MRKMLMRNLATLILCLPLAGVWAQSPPSDSASAAPQAGAQAKPRYANMPDEAVPYRRFTKPYKEWYVDPNTLEYNGAARNRPDGDLSQMSEVAIGFLGPLVNNPESVFGIPMLHGAQLAIEEANARGGYQGKPFALKIHNDSALWGASSTEIVKMLYDEDCWAMLGSIDGQSTHIALRVTLKVEMPIMDTGTTDPTVTETRIPWLMHNFPDDRHQGYALAEYAFKQLKLKRIGVLRTQTRYARLGVAKFADEARRMGRQPLLEVKFERGDMDFSKQLQMLRDAQIDGLVIWGEEPEAALILKQMRAMGMNQPVFAGSRISYPQLLQDAGAAAEGLVATTAMDPTRQDPSWKSFEDRYRQKFNETPDPYATYAYDGMSILIGAIQKAGLNRGRIMDALRDYQMKAYDGVAGHVPFDRTLNSMAPVTMTQVHDGKFVYWQGQTPPPEVKAEAENR
ncbi:MAG TPA: ABC transporter substrate-binding protein [Terriglobia bacterium]|nr:ABC transporter substrate-binding protein [Terriglobia bacterium]